MTLGVPDYEEVPDHRLDLVPTYLRSKARARRRAPLLDEVERFCYFIGYPRSGSTLVGQFLNAHPDVVISHELHVGRYVSARFDREQIYSLILDRDRWFASREWEWTGHSYEVEEGWQGRWRNLEVIGDKKAGVTSNWLGEDLSRLDLLRDRVGDPLRVLHVVRNPYDMIASDADACDAPVSDAAGWCLARVEANARVRRRLGGDELLEVHLEDLVEAPREVLPTLLDFLGVEPDKAWVERCADVLFDSPSETRHGGGWPAETRERVEGAIATHEFLDGYAFDD